MNQLPYDDLNQLTVYIKATYSGNQEQQEKATEILHEMGKDQVRFVDTMLSLIASDGPANEITFNLKRATCVLIPTILTLHEKDFLEQPKPLLNMLLEAFFSDKVSFTLKPSLSPVFLLFYSTDANGELRKEGLAIIKDKLSNGTVNEYYAALYILQTIVTCSKLLQKTTANWLQHLLEGLVKSGSNLVNGIILEIQETIKGADQPTKLNNIFVGGTVLKLWMEMIILFTNLLGKPETQLTFHPEYVKFMLVQEHILEILKRILILHIPTEKQIPGCLMSTCGVGKVDDLLNSIKCYVLECFNTLLEHMQTYPILNQDMWPNHVPAPDPNVEPNLNPTAPTYTVNKFYQYMKTEAIKLVLDSSYRFCRTEALDIDKALDEQTYLQSLLVEGLKFLTKLTVQKDLYNVFAAFRNHLVIDVCLPLIRSTIQEIVDFQEDPDQFVQLALDTCQKQVSETAKTQAAQLLEHMCSHIDGVLSYTVVMLLQMIDFSLVSNDIAAIPEKFPRLVDYQNSIFVTKTDHATRVETCLIVLANLSYLITVRHDLMEIVERVFGEYSEFFLGEKATPLIQSRLCLFLAFFLEHIFQAEDKQQLYQAYLGFLINCAGAKGDELETVAEQANHSLCIIFDSGRGQIQRLAPFAQDILIKLTSFIKDAESSQFFELILEIFKTYESSLKENENLLFEMLKQMVERANAEYEAVKSDPEGSKLTLAKIWHIIRGIAETKDLVLRYQDQIEGLLTPLIAYMEKDDKLPFEEDILAYMASVIKIRNEVTPLMWTIFQLFPRIFNKHEGMIWHLFAPLNQMIIHGTQYLNEHPEEMQKVIDIGIQGLNPKNTKANSANVSEAALILQLCIQYLTLTNEVWENILLASLEKLKTIQKGFLHARVGGVFLFAFLTNFPLTQAIVVNQNAAGFLVDHFIKNVLSYETHPYDRKVFLVCLTSFLGQPELDPSIMERLPKILSLLIPIFKYVEMVEQIELGKGNAAAGVDSDDEDYSHQASDPAFLKDFLKDDFNPAGKDPNAVPKNLFEALKTGAGEEEKDEYDDYDADDLLIVLTAEDEANKQLDKFETAFKKQDEFAIFKKVIFEMRDTCLDRLQELCNSLPPHKRGFLNDILNSQRVIVDEAAGKSQARKIVKPRARKVATNIQFSNSSNPNNNDDGPM